MENFINLIIVINFIIFIVLIAWLIRWQKSHGRLTEKKLAIILTSYFCFSVVTTSLPLIQININATIIIDFIFLALFWGIGFPWFRWLYRKLNSKK
jgi:hypothetical protein